MLTFGNIPRYTQKCTHVGKYFYVYLSEDTALLQYSIPYVIFCVWSPNYRFEEGVILISHHSFVFTSFSVNMPYRLTQICDHYSLFTHLHVFLGAFLNVLLIFSPVPLLNGQLRHLTIFLSDVQFSIPDTFQSYLPYILCFQFLPIQVYEASLLG